MKFLLTGGAGFIGNHTALALLEAGHEVVVVDNYSNSSPEATKRVEKLTGKKIASYDLDVRDKNALMEAFTLEEPDAVIHFAGYKAIGESCAKPIEYYRNNLDSTLALLECMRECGVDNIIFSSSASVYGVGHDMPVTEEDSKGVCTNPYSWTKSMIEQILVDTADASDTLTVVLLRYFNPIGAHESGQIGEDPTGIPNNLMPYITRVAAGQLPQLTIFGNDYPTPDGTCLRDYVHVMDLAEGHVRAAEYMLEHGKTFETEVFNLGTGTPYSVLDIVNAFEKANGVEVPHVFGERRRGDVAELYADVSKAERVLGWKATRDLEEMCRDSWNWQSNNPLGYKE